MLLFACQVRAHDVKSYSLLSLLHFLLFDMVFRRVLVICQNLLLFGLLLFLCDFLFLILLFLDLELPKIIRKVGVVIRFVLIFTFDLFLLYVHIDNLSGGRSILVFQIEQPFKKMMLVLHFFAQFLKLLGFLLFVNRR